MKPIFVTKVGSQLYGTATLKSDIDFKGFGFEDVDQIIGLKTFTQQEYNNHEPDGPSKMEGTIYSVKRYLSLCLSGNPTVIEVAFAGSEHHMHNTVIGEEIRQFVQKNFMTKALFKPYSAYHMAQVKKLQSMNRTGKRAEEILEFGYDAKFAGHAYRLARQCCIVMGEGVLRPTLDPADKELCMEIRSGIFTKEKVLEILMDVDKQMYDIYSTSTIPEKPNYETVNEFLVNVYTKYLGNEYNQQLEPVYKPCMEVFPQEQKS